MNAIRAAVWAGLLTLGLAAIQASAAVLTVTNLNDSGAGSLRATIAAATPADTITFAVTGTIVVATPLAITQNAIIQGPGAASLTIDGNNLVRVIDVTAGTLTLSGVTIANGNVVGLGGGILIAGAAGLRVRNSVFFSNNANNGGGISVSVGGTLTAANSTFDGNTATAVGGGAIINFGTATVTASTFTGNTAPVNGGAINVQPASTLTLVNTTFSGNTSGGLGGAISTLGAGMTISSSTFSANNASSGAAVASGSAWTVNNSVFVDNTAAGTPVAFNPLPAVGSNNVFFNNNVLGTPDDATGYGTTNFVVAAVQPLGPLANNGGPTLTMLPVAGGAAICAGDSALLPPGTVGDQRGQPRLGNAGCLDAGSVQRSQAALAGLQGIPTMSLPMMLLLAALMGAVGIVSRRRSIGS